MNKKVELEDKIDDLVAEIDQINERLKDIAHNSTSRGKIKTERVNWTKIDKLDKKYEIWYNKALTLISEYIPERRATFRESYSEVDRFLHFDDMEYTEVNKYCGLLRRVISKQRNLLLSIPPKLETERLKVRRGLSDEIITEELYQAKTLLDDANIRAAGVVAGVALERHLLTLCEVCDREIEYDYSDGIRSLAESLYIVDEITQTTKGQLEHLADIRNDCAHANEEEPDERGVERLIEQAEELVRDA